MKATAFNRYTVEVGRIPTIDATTERELARAYRAGDREAGHKIITSHLRLAIRIASRYAPLASLEDLAQQAAEGMLIALESFDETRGWRFMTYANMRIRERIQIELDKRTLVNVPSGSENRKVSLMIRRGHVRTPEDLAEAKGISMKRALGYWYALANNTLSFDQSDDDGEPFGARALGQAPTETDPFLGKQIASALAALDPRSRDVIESRYVADVPQTLDEIANRYSLTRERIRQIEADALQMLRHRLRHTYKEITEAA